MTDSRLSDALRYALFDLRTVNPHLPDTYFSPNFPSGPQITKGKLQSMATLLSQLLVPPDELKSFLLVSTKLSLRNKRKMLCFSMDFGG